ncbi:hypothetical protein QYM36_008249, partial [Artemia franciscana]
FPIMPKVSMKAGMIQPKIGKNRKKKPQFVVEGEDGEGPITFDTYNTDSDEDSGSSESEMSVHGDEAPGKSSAEDSSDLDEKDVIIDRFSAGDSSDNDNKEEVKKVTTKSKNLIRKRASLGDVDEAKVKKLQERVSNIKNKIKRQEEYKKLKEEKKKLKRRRVLDRKIMEEELGDKAPEKKKPRTIETTREEDLTTVKEDDIEVKLDIETDEFKDYFGRTYEPKVLITTADNPHVRTLKFMRMLEDVIPNSVARWRNRSSVKKMCKKAIANGYTDVAIINEDIRVPNGLLLCHLPSGPTAYFRVSNVKMPKHLAKRSQNEITSHRPEVILNNFTTRLGHGVSRMLAALFHYDPQFRGRRAVTFHNQRDYIFFRHH